MAKNKSPLELLANSIGIEGGNHNGNIDAFRHIYASAQTTKAYDAPVARILGSGKEWKTHIEGKVGHFLGIKDDNKQIMQDGNPTNEWQMDEHNNAIGRDLGERPSAEGWDHERLLKEIGKAFSDGRVKTLSRGEDPNAPTGYPGYGAGEESTTQKIVYPLDKAAAEQRKNRKPLFASWQHGGKKTGYNPYRTPPIVAQPAPQEMSAPASILDSLLQYFRKK